MNKVVLFIFYDKNTGKVLREKRPATHPHYPNQSTFPSGKIEEDEASDFLKALLRELKEEMDIVPKEFVLLQDSELIIGDEDKNILYPYLITQWEGDIPSTIIDKGNPLIWETFDEVSASPIRTSRIIIQLIKDYLHRK